jgi:hypothetical protein
MLFINGREPLDGQIFTVIASHMRESWFNDLSIWVESVFHLFTASYVKRSPYTVSDHCLARKQVLH